ICAGGSRYRARVTSRTESAIWSPTTPHISTVSQLDVRRAEPAIARCAHRPITTTPVSSDTIPEVPVGDGETCAENAGYCSAHPICRATLRNTRLARGHVARQRHLPDGLQRLGAGR